MSQKAGSTPAETFTPDARESGGRHRRKEHPLNVGRLLRNLQVIRPYGTAHTHTDHVDPSANDEAAYWSSLREMRDNPEAPLSLERHPVDVPRLGISRMAKRVGEDPFSSHILEMIERRNQLVSPDVIAAEDRDIAKRLQERREEYGGLPDFEKRRVHQLMEAEEVPQEFVESYYQNGATNWCDWIAKASDNELIALARWHHELSSSKPTEQQEHFFLRAYNRYVQGLETAIAEGSLSPKLLERLKAYKNIDLVVPGPLDPMLRLRNGYNYPQMNTFAIAMVTDRDQQEIFAHELTHALGQLEHDDSPLSVEEETATETIAQVCLYGEDTLQSGSYLPLRKAYADIGGYVAEKGDAPLTTKELSEYYVTEDSNGFREEIKEKTGFDLVGYLRLTFARRREVEYASRAAEQTGQIMSDILQYLRTGKRETAKSDRIDKPLMDYYIAHIDAVTRYPSVN